MLHLKVIVHEIFFDAFVHKLAIHHEQALGDGAALDIKFIFTHIAIALDELALMNGAGQLEENVRVGINSGEGGGLDDAAGNLLGAQA